MDGLSVLPCHISLDLENDHGSRIVVSQHRGGRFSFTCLRLSRKRAHIQTVIAGTRVPGQRDALGDREPREHARTQ